MVGKNAEKVSLTDKKSESTVSTTPKTSTNPAAKTAPKAKPQPKRLKLPVVRKIHIKPSQIIFAIVAVVFLAFFLRVAIWEHNYFTSMEGSERDVVASAGEDTVYEGGEEVDDTEPTEQEVQEYIVAPDKPRYFRIPSLGINTIVVEVGLKENNEMATPYNIYHAGWYTGSALPGTDQVSIINAHGGDLGYGIFRNLPRIQNGAIIEVEMGDGRIYKYRVVDTATIPLGDEANQYMATAFTSPQPGVGALTLITCTGEWSELRQTYLDRFFARAVLE